VIPSSTPASRASPQNRAPISQATGWLLCDRRFIPHAATWLNGARWQDELTTPVGGIDADRILQRRRETVEALIRGAERLEKDRGSNYTERPK